MRSKTFIFSILTILCAAAIFVVAFAYFRVHQEKTAEDTPERSYSRYYAMITDDPKSFFWQYVYQGASAAAEEKDTCVELFGSNLSFDYSPEELMEIAIASDVDGIMVCGGDSEEMDSLIDRAVDSGIPVVTMYSDNAASRRCSFVGVSAYNIGREYGRQIVRVREEMERQVGRGRAASNECSVTVFFDSSQLLYDQNVILSGIMDTLNRDAPGTHFTVKNMVVDDSNPFSVEEGIRDVFMEGTEPDILVCLSEMDTSCAYQAVVDFNLVGKVYILGYYDSEKILNAISRNVVFSTLAVDTGELGRYSVEALNEYIESGNTSEYFAADVTIIDRGNVSEYLHKEETDEKALQ
ncbi:MAG: substrate-binding domain-containing protein [Lachnospiraceae bacterium]|nr:substrate-binding domain-containing protein [Lachnospiraceae bacterium]